MAPGGAELGPRGISDCRADDDAGAAACCVPCEHPMSATTPAATTDATHRRDRLPYQRTVPIYATLAAVIEPFGFWECCRP